MVESESFGSFGSLDGLSGRYCNIEFMIGMMVGEHGQASRNGYTTVANFFGI